MNAHYHLDTRHAPFNEHYLQRMWAVINNATGRHPRTLVVIAILRLPEYGDIGDSLCCNINFDGGVLSRFIESLKEKIKAAQNRKIKQNIRVHASELRYA